MSKKIDVSTKKHPNTYTIVDDEDYEKLNQYKWRAHLFYSGLYVRRNDYSGEKRVDLLMHRVIMNTPHRVLVDHINHDPLDNRKCNLRNCTSSENQMNSNKQSNNTSGYKGVSWHHLTNKWLVALRINKKKTHIGLFTCLIKAAKAYDEAARKHYGEFAKTNF